MVTITGIILGTSGEPIHTAATFKSKSTPLVRDGEVVANTTERLKTNATDGSFSIELVEGKYDVTYFTLPDQTRFEITVPTGGGTYSIDDVTSSDITFVYIAPNTVWTGGGGNQTGTGSPVGVKVPDVIGQFYVDLTPPYALWFATGLTNADWQELLGS